eukprot:CAMPEP_0197661960 /NCGR_PEP_ID=MMETSP1338-20131121/51772_1 /TAXON_ID=43686 ORGANISM="Pelagodinium beii, Strain RCC1491" /NCGR_SAMPLE_ID=MMETSP1338 /ASSEMBLY_ACC=CAM_ASM_000754 /LENGTH=32 /DNA_ID= /DNA_START= /DNA_END= /DNA_ORIENTATION=
MTSTGGASCTIFCQDKADENQWHNTDYHEAGH